MSHLQTSVFAENTPLSAEADLACLKTIWGTLPNVFHIMSQSPEVLGGYVSFYASLSKTSLDAATRERIALAISEVNDCHYGLAAHSYRGRLYAKLTSAEIQQNRKGRSTDAKADVAIRFARTIAVTRGPVDTSLFDEVKTAGFTTAQILEIIAHVALTILTNYTSEIFKTEIDFPHLEKLSPP